MLEIMKKLQNLNYENESETETSSDDEFEKFVGIDLDKLSVEEFEELLGEGHLHTLKGIISSGVTPDWLKTADIHTDNETKQKQSPWFVRFKPSCEAILENEGLPDFVPQMINNAVIPNIKELTKRRPSDFLWNNLLEIVLIYAFVYSQFEASELKSSLVLEAEVRPIVLEMCSSLQQPASPFTSAMDAIESAKSAIFFNSNDHDLSEIFSGSLDIFNYSKFISLMLADVLFWFSNESSSTEERFAKKKIIFMISWFNAEIQESSRAVDEILKMLSNILSEVKNE